MAKFSMEVLNSMYNGAMARRRRKLNPLDMATGALTSPIPIPTIGNIIGKVVTQETTTSRINKPVYNTMLLKPGEDPFALKDSSVQVPTSFEPIGYNPSTWRPMEYNEETIRGIFGKSPKSIEAWNKFPGASPQQRNAAVLFARAGQNPQTREELLNLMYGDREKLASGEIESGTVRHTDANNWYTIGFTPEKKMEIYGTTDVDNRGNIITPDYLIRQQEKESQLLNQGSIDIDDYNKEMNIARLEWENSSFGKKK